MTATTFAWLALASPLAGTLINALGFRVIPAVHPKLPSVIGTLALALAFIFTVITFFALEDRGAEHRQLVSSLYDYTVVGSLDAKVAILVPLGPRESATISTSLRPPRVVPVRNDPEAPAWM